MSNERYKGHKQELKAWTPTRRELIEELGTASDRELGLKYSLSTGRVRQLRREMGIASHTENKKRTPLSELQEKVQSLEDEVFRLREFVQTEREAASREGWAIVAASARCVDEVPQLLNMKNELSELVRREVRIKTSHMRRLVDQAVHEEVARVQKVYEIENRKQGKKLFELPGFVYQEFSGENT